MRQIIIRIARKVFPGKAYYQLVDLFLKIRYFLLFFIYSGRRVECPICQKKLKCFLPNGVDLPVLRENKVVGGGFNLQEKCPYCHCLARERLIYLYLKRKTDLFQKKYRLLHVAPEKELQKALKRALGQKYLSADLDSPLAMVKMNLTRINNPDNAFGAIICSHVLEHIVEDKKAMKEIYRVLKPGGWAILQVPISLALKKTHQDLSVKTPAERERVFGQSDHFRLYGQDYQKKLEEVGFLVKPYDFAREFGKKMTDYFGLVEEEKLYVCFKPKR